MADRHPTQVEELHVPKFRIRPEGKIATAGSCFAQHISRHLKERGFEVLDVEPPPPGLNQENATRFGFGLYSARYGNIYLARQLLQLAREALGRSTPADAVWERNGRYFDALRPSVEPAGMGSAEEVIANRRSHLEAVLRLFRRADVFVFTFGLTEGWVHTASGTVFPTAPGTLAGTFDPGVYSFQNFSYDEVLSDFVQFRDLVHGVNPATKFLLTVSPVPLAATASGNHVLVATTHSKSVLRAVAGQLAAQFDDVDYFPSYELIASPWARGFFFEPDLRNVTEAGVQLVMRVFVEAYAGHSTAAPAGGSGDRFRSGKEQRLDEQNRDIPCEEALLEAFGK